MHSNKVFFKGNYDQNSGMMRRAAQWEVAKFVH
jgi:hypothetical protein